MAMPDAAQNNSAAVTLEDLVNSVQFRTMSDIVRQFTGMRLALATPELTGFKTLFEQDDTAPLCRMIHTKPAGRNACRLDAMANARHAANSHNAVCRRCHAGLYDMMVPIYIEGRHVANFSCGELLDEPPSAKGWRRYRMPAKRFGLDPGKLKAAYMAMPHLPPAKIQLALKMVSMMAEYFREVGRRLKKAPTPGLAKVMMARQYIEANFRGQFQIKQVAEHVRMSPTYLSALFRKHEGLTLVRYIEQMRIDEARKLLGKPDKNITEIAYAVGFNNLTHFNRVFRKIAAGSPSEYRARIAPLRDACLT